MRIPLTKYGLPEVLVYPALVAVLMVVLGLIGLAILPGWPVILAEAVLAGILFVVFWFFRDPKRDIQAGQNILLAPADGKINDMEIVLGDAGCPMLDARRGSTIEDRGSRTLRIGIFMGIFDTHINRSPCNARVEKVTYKPGNHTNAADPRCGRVNESNDLDLVRTDSPRDRLIVRQISGAIARRIVCQAREGQELAAGEKFGMVKFGSRCELYVPTREDLKCLVKIGDKVKAGLTPLIKYEIRSTKSKTIPKFKCSNDRTD